MSIHNEHLVGPCLLFVSRVYSKDVKVEYNNFTIDINAPLLWPMIYLYDIEIIGCTSENVWLDLTELQHVFA